jgi:hypothetical protein
VRTPEFSGAFGWADPPAEPEKLLDRWQLAEARTDRMLGRHLAVLTASERADLVALAQTLLEPAAS